MNLTRLLLAGVLAVSSATMRAQAADAEKIAESASSHWSFTPPGRPAEPAVRNSKWARNPIDRFILARLESAGLPPSAEADRHTLIRRVTFDLTGLPPTPDEIGAFIKDTSADAYEKLIERLLASPQYGVRQARHWLDVAGYADSNGYFDADSDRPLAYKYRDYVVRSFNADKPFDQFVREQVAGDELAGYGIDGDVTPQTADLLIATHFMRNAPDGTGESDGNALEVSADRYAVLEGTVQIIGSAFLGLTVQCARCHNHKFEPVSQEEYYQLQAILKPAYNHAAWVKPNDRKIPLATKVQREQHKKSMELFDREQTARKDALAGSTKPFTRLLQREALEGVPNRDEIIKAFETKEKDRDDKAKALIKPHEVSLTIKDEVLFKRFPELQAPVKALRDSLAKHEAAKPAPIEQLSAVTDLAKDVPDHHLLLRGVYNREGRPVAPGAPAVLSSRSNTYQIDPPPGGSTGRRLAFAKWVTAANHPTFACMMVNRIWLTHFGTGIVATPDNFGVTGAKPSHPELLDYLATEFIRQNWSVKSIHRLIVLSATYRQSRSPSPGIPREGRGEGNLKPQISNQLDPDNRLLSRFPLQRLDSESIRDAMLAASGQLDPKLGGPYTPIGKAPDGQVVVDEARPDAVRRSLYLQQRRTQPAGLLDVFDGARMNPNCTRRNPSTVSLQSLALLNSDFVRTRSRAMAKRIIKEKTETAGRIELAFILAYARPPTESERALTTEFLSKQLAHYASKKSIEEDLWTDLAQMLLASNGFLYVD